jgi:hypothetical protein
MAEDKGRAEVINYGEVDNVNEELKNKTVVEDQTLALMRLVWRRTAQPSILCTIA